jgi:O-antigen ligase
MPKRLIIALICHRHKLLDPILLLLLVFFVAVKFLLSRCLRTYTYRHTDGWKAFTKYGVQMGSGAMMYIGSGIQNLMGGGIHRYTNRKEIA